MKMVMVEGKAGKPPDGVFTQNDEEVGSRSHGESDCRADDSVEDDLLVGVPVDKGWAWMILTGASAVLFIVFGVIKSGGIFFIQFQRRFESSASMTSMISSVQNATLSVVTLLVTTIGMKKLNGRKCLIIGGSILTVAYIITALADDIKILICSFGILTGIGLAFIMTPSVVMLGFYFKLRRGLANSLCYAGSSLGALVFAPFLNVLFEFYGYRGCILIIAALMLNTWVCGALYRPLSFYNKRHKKATVLSRKGHKSNCIMNNTSTVSSPNNLLNKRHMVLSQEEPKPRTVCSFHSGLRSGAHLKSNHSDRIKNGDITLNLAQETSSTPALFRTRTMSTGHRRPRTLTEGSRALGHILNDITIGSLSSIRSAQFASNGYVCASLGSLNFENISGMHTKSPKVRETETDSNCCAKLLLEIFDISLLKNPVFLLFLPCAFVFCSAHALVPIFIAPYAKDIGLSDQDTAVLLSIIGAVDLVSRIVIGYISDKHWIQRTTMITIAGVLEGTLCNLLYFFDSFGVLVFFAVVAGILGGVYFSLYACILVDFLGLGKLQKALGFTILLHGIGSAATYPIIGALRDSSNNYLSAFHLLGGYMYFGAVCMYLLPVVHRKSQSARDTGTEEREIETLMS